MNEIKCPYDLNQFILGEPIFENTFSEEECEKRKFYGDCYHCFATAIASRDHQIKTAEQVELKKLDHAKLKAELDYAKFRCALPTIMDMMAGYKK